jgi:hypothetical protein
VRCEGPGAKPRFPPCVVSRTPYQGLRYFSAHFGSALPLRSGLRLGAEPTGPVKPGLTRERRRSVGRLRFKHAQRVWEPFSGPSERSRVSEVDRLRLAPSGAPFGRLLQRQCW